MHEERSFYNESRAPMAACIIRYRHTRKEMYYDNEWNHKQFSDGL